MESIDVLTGQHVVIQYEPAGILRRGCALAIDVIVMILYGYIISYILSKTAILMFLAYKIRDIIHFVFYLPILFYHFFFESLMNGRTIGKIIAGTRVTHIDGSTPGLTSYFLRWLLLPIDIFPIGVGIGGLFIIFSKNHQRIGDLAAGTVVVRNAKPPQLDLDTDFIEFSDDYQPTFREVELLSDGQIRFITGMLYDPRNKRAITASLQTLSARVKELLKINSALDDRTFLETLVRDYNFYAWHGM
ncbi:MAG: RDD family protein [Candidatus Azobacteroides sp.]|nr:RDD family protein [Candidatus Azobacteroides sp.]